MDRFLQLSYCTVCVNHKNNLKKGVICGITNRPAEFEQSCSDYIFDEIKSNEIKHRLQSQIDLNYSSKNLVSELLAREIYEDVQEVELYDRFVEKHYKWNSVIHKIGFIFFFGYTAYLISKSWNEILNLEKIVLPIVFIFMLICILINFNLKKRKFISITKYGIINNATKIPWNDILLSGKTYQYVGEGFSGDKIILGTKSRGLVEIDISEFDISTAEFLKIINTGIKSVSALQ